MFSHSLYRAAAEDLKGNPGQWAAYQSTGHCVVIAGPGSGKTKTLTVKMAQLITEEIPDPRGIACITYNAECARELKTRLSQLGIDPGPRVFIGTVHAFSLTQIVLPYARPAGLDLPRDFKVATRTEWTSALGRASTKLFGHTNNLSDLHSEMGVHRRSILDRTSSEWREKNSRLSRLVETYEANLRAQGLIDFDDMPLLAVRAIKQHDWIRKSVEAKFPILCVDEYQDLGHALHSMVTNLCFESGIRLFAVGDKDQSIYGFTGANPEHLDQLTKQPDVQMVPLRLNYRCGSRIVKASGYALGESRDYEVPVDAHEGLVVLHPRPTSQQEQARFVFSELLPQIQERYPGIQYRDIAILYPAAFIGDALISAANTISIPTIRTDTKSAYPRHSRIMHWLELCAQWCCMGWETSTPKFSQLSSDARQLFDEYLLTPASIRLFEKTLLQFLWDRRNVDSPINQWLVDLSTQILVPIFDACRTIQDEAAIFNDFLETTNQGSANNKMTLFQFAGQGDGSNSINLSTLHSAKGKEFSVVILFGMDGNRLPRRGATPTEVLESRRAFYVGFTRAKHEIHLIYSSDNPSPFVDEVEIKILTEDI